MKLNKLYIALGLTLLLSSCKSDEPVRPMDMEAEVPMSFVLSLSSNMSGTRAVDPNAPNIAEDEDEESKKGTDFDNKIENVKAFIYSVNASNELNERIAEMTVYDNNIIHQKDAAGNVLQEKYLISGKMRTLNGKTVANLETGKYRLVIFANINNNDLNKFGNSSDHLSKLGTAYFTCHGIPYGNDAFNSIPMYGVGDATFKDISKKDIGETYTIQNGSGNGDLTVNMLRAMAKVRVKWNQNNADLSKRGMKLKSIALSRHSERGYFAPKFWNDTPEKALAQANWCNVYIQNDFHSECPAINATDDIDEDPNNSGMIRFYVPDTYNIDSDEEETEQIHDHGNKQIELMVTYEIDGEEKTHPIYFRKYGSDGKPVEGEESWDLIRNHIYEFVINGVESSGQLDIEVSVKKWDYHVVTTEL